MARKIHTRESGAVKIVVNQTGWNGKNRNFWVGQLITSSRLFFTDKEELNWQPANRALNNRRNEGTE
jgi:hypothetical protein